MSALSRLPDVSDLRIIDATLIFDRRWGLQETVRQVRKYGTLGPCRIIIPPKRPGGAYREIRSADGRKFYQLEMSVWDSRSRKKSKALPKKATRRAAPRGPAFLWRDWPPLLK